MELMRTDGDTLPEMPQTSLHGYIGGAHHLFGVRISMVIRNRGQPDYSRVPGSVGFSCSFFLSFCFLKSLFFGGRVEEGAPQAMLVSVRFGHVRLSDDAGSGTVRWIEHGCLSWFLGGRFSVALKGQSG